MRPTPFLSDSSPEELWKGFIRGKEDCFKSLFYQYHPELCRYGTRITADEELTRDTIQELFIKLWLNRSELPEVHAVKSYLFRCLRNDLLKKMRTHKRVMNGLTSGPPGFRPGDAAGIIPEVLFSPEELITQAETMQIHHTELSQALNKLPKREKEVIYLRFYEELPYAEIADIMRISYQSVMNYLYQGFARLKNNHRLRQLVEHSLCLVLLIQQVCARAFS